MSTVYHIRDTSLRRGLERLRDTYSANLKHGDVAMIEYKVNREWLVIQYVFKNEWVESKL